jgi:hypothetical protein
VDLLFDPFNSNSAHVSLIMLYNKTQQKVHMEPTPTTLVSRFLMDLPPFLGTHLYLPLHLLHLGLPLSR